MPYKQMIEEVLVNLRDLIKRRTEQIGKGQYIRYVCDGRKDPKGPRIYPPAHYSSTTQKTHYPVGMHGDLRDSGALLPAVIDATTRYVYVRPPAGQMYEVHSIRMIASVTALGRTAALDWYDGINTIPVWQSGAGGIASGDDFLIYPVDLSTLMTGAAILIGSPPLRALNEQYLRWSNTDLAAAETLTLQLRYDRRDISGL